MAIVRTGVKNGLRVHKCAKWLLCAQLCQMAIVCTGVPNGCMCAQMWQVADVRSSVPTG